MRSKTRSVTRAYPRYFVTGSAQLTANRRVSPAVVVQLGFGGMLLRGGRVLPVGTIGIVKFKVREHRNVVEAPYKIVGNRNALMALEFTSQPRELAEIIQWLAIGKFAISGEDQAAGQRCCTSFPKNADPKNREELMEYLYS